MTDEDFQRLATLYLEDAINETDLELLNRELSRVPERLRQFNDLRLLLGAIHEFGQSSYEGDHPLGKEPSRRLVPDGDSHSLPSRGVPDTGWTGLPAANSNARWTYFLVATAVMVALAFVLHLSNQDAGNQSKPTAALAHLTYQSGAQWTEHRDVGSAIGVETLGLRGGLAKLEFANGACVTLEGPALFEVVGPKQTLLHSGVLTAHVPESAIGFRVDTPALEVIDRGTAFGVSVGEDGLTSVSVFEGEVDVSPRATGSEQPTLQRVVEGQAIRATHESAILEMIQLETDPYEQVWPINSGVLQTSGPMKFVSPGPTFVPGLYEDGENIVVFPERRGVLLEEPIPVDLTDPGEYIRRRKRPQFSLPAGHRVQSYLLQLNPSRRIKSNVVGQITFEHPILGLVLTSNGLFKTDATLGHPNGDYDAKWRGVESSREPGGGLDRDTVILTANRKTLILSLAKGSAFDQIRVIVEDVD